MRWSRAGEFLEHATVFGNHYGTPKEPVMVALARRQGCAVRHRLAGHPAIEPAGARRSGQHFRAAAVHAELERRLRVRAQDAEDVVQARMAKANDEISHWAEYDYVVINDDLEHAQGEDPDHPAAERMKRSRASRHSSFVEAES